MARIVLYSLFTYSFIDRSSSTPDDPKMTFEQLYQYGKYEYTDGNWPDCIAFMKRALDDFQYFEDELVWCRRKCGEQVESPDDGLMSQKHAQSERALCLLRCKRERFTEERPPLAKMSVYFDFVERKPFQYLHICHWKIGELAKAVQSAYTFLVQNPADKDTLDGLAFYMEQPGYHDNMLVDLLRRTYEKKDEGKNCCILKVRFISGVQAYEAEDWHKCIDDFESSIEKTIDEDSSILVDGNASINFRCRLLCEDKIDWSAIDGNPEIDVLLTSMQSSVIRCQHNCLYRLALINGHNVGQLLAAHYEYLHYCQYQLMRGSEAARSVANYLLFDDNPLMRRNKYFYAKQYKNKDLFIPDQGMIWLHKQRTLEERYLTFIEEKFQYINNEFPPERQEDRMRFNTHVSIEDTFDYDAVTKLLNSNECKTLRSVFPPKHAEQLIEELEKRVRELWPIAIYRSRSCARETRQADCRRAIVLSIDIQDCSEWLGAMHSGCVIIFCA
ncbi:unnamed protein product [Angiostrongylus costaricensis]|uniref:Procollagen-proline 3-dioxygenase n=1 Tax=Angiostrongylus costaricensis TaxID=334426 RepID=A0A0R3PQ95_ANGCS|nr:unnamed protein product [Angiostrongylus costaricensis]